MIGDAAAEPPSTYDRLRQDILDGTLPPGRPLVEAVLAARYQVSRTPVREALRRLEQDGLVERVDRTMRVRRHSAEEILELYEVRTILETAAVRAAAERRTEFDVARMERLLRRMEASNLTREQRAPLNREFHSALWRASHNGVLFDTLERLYVHSLRYLHTTLTGQERWDASLRQHRDIVDAILAGDGEAAAGLLGEHLREARDIRLQLLEP